MNTMLDGSLVPTPKQIAARLPRNRAKVGDTILFRNQLTMLEERAVVEGVLPAADGLNKVYEVYGRRSIHSRHVLEVIAR